MKQEREKKTTNIFYFAVKHKMDLSFFYKMLAT